MVSIKYPPLHFGLLSLRSFSGPDWLLFFLGSRSVFRSNRLLLLRLNLPSFFPRCRTTLRSNRFPLLRFDLPSFFPRCRTTLGSNRFPLLRQRLPAYYPRSWA